MHNINMPPSPSFIQKTGSISLTFRTPDGYPSYPNEPRKGEGEIVEVSISRLLNAARTSVEFKERSACVPERIMLCRKEIENGVTYMPCAHTNYLSQVEIGSGFHRLYAMLELGFEKAWILTNKKSLGKIAQLT